jgi:hypothetical protein
MLTLRHLPSVLFCAVLVLAGGRADAQTISHDRSVQMWAVVQSSPPRITLNWLSHANTTGFTLYRKLKGGTDWGTSIASLGATSTQYVDNSVSLNTSYEYKVIRNTSNLGQGFGYVNAGIEVAMVEARGTVVLVVDNTFSSSLATQLLQVQTDLEGDGWKVIRPRREPDRPRDRSEKLDPGGLQRRPHERESGAVDRTCSVPYSGDLAPDGHSEHYGAWPADVYYGEMTSSWTDNTINDGGATDPRNHNLVVMASSTDNDPILGRACGRSRRLRQPAGLQPDGDHAAEQLHGQAARLEAQAHHRADPGRDRRQLRRLRQCVRPGGMAWLRTAGATCQRFRQRLFHADVLRQLPLELWLRRRWWDNAGGVGSTAQFATSNLAGIFTILFGSYFGDFDCTNNFLRAALASGTTLTNFWSGYPNWFIHHMGLGETIGYETVLTQNNANNHYEPNNGQRGRVHICLMGDPTLRMHVVAPPSAVACSYINSSTATITWAAAPDAVIGYHVYRFDGSNWVRRTSHGRDRSRVHRQHHGPGRNGEVHGAGAEAGEQLQRQLLQPQPGDPGSAGDQRRFHRLPWRGRRQRIAGYFVQRWQFLHRQ